MSPSFHRSGEPEGAHYSLLHSTDGEITTQGREGSLRRPGNRLREICPRAQSPRQGGEPQIPGALVLSQQLDTWQGSCVQRAACLAGLQGKGGRWGL